VDPTGQLSGGSGPLDPPASYAAVGGPKTQNF